MIGVAGGQPNLSNHTDSALTRNVGDGSGRIAASPFGD